MQQLLQFLPVLFVQASLPPHPLLLATILHLILATISHFILALLSLLPLTAALALIGLVRDNFKLFGWGKGGVAEAENGEHEKQQRGDVLGSFGFEGGNDGLRDKH